MLLHRESLMANCENVRYIKNFKKWYLKNTTFQLFFENGKIEIIYFKGDIIKVFVGEDFDQPVNTCAILSNLDTQKISVTETNTFLIIEGDKINTKIEKETLKITFTKQDGTVLCEDFKPMGKDYKKSFVFKTNDCIAYYGFGEKTGNLNKKGEYIENFNTDNPQYGDETRLLYKTIPFYIGLKEDVTYGIYLDNSFRSYFDMGKSFNDRIFFGAEDGTLQYYFIPGMNIKEVIKNYSYLTGTMNMPPEWTLGYQQCRYSYSSQEEVLELAKTFRKKGIPCDTIYLDIDYMDNYKIMTFNKNTFSNPENMIKELNKIGFKIVAILDPGVKKDEEYSVYQNGIKGKHFVMKKDGEIFYGEVWPGLSAFPDFANENTCTWWKKELKDFIKLGISGIWNDMNEPAVFNNNYKTIDESCIHNYGESEVIEHKQFHNLYGMKMSKCSTEAQLELIPNRRPFSMTRATFAGGQRYSSIWTGDNQSTWEHMRMSIPMNCNLGLSGFSYIGNDVGGFALDCTQELFIRWTELGTFLPIFRNHSAIFTRRQEPWSFGRNVENIVKKFIKLRYELIPYIYNEFYKSYETGTPIFRPMVLEFNQDINVLNMQSQFMFGDNILVAPILYENEKMRGVYFPKGKWYDYFNNMEYIGGKYYNISIPLDSIGLFVKENSIIPIYKQCYSNLGERPSMVTFKIYKGNGNTQYYEDDGITNEYKNGQYNLYNIYFENNNNQTFRVTNVHKGYKDLQYTLEYL